MKSISENVIINPFLRWTGSKRWLIKNHINSFLPKQFNNYHEPFLGGGSVFFYLKGEECIQKKYFLSDSNEDLINCYTQLRDNPLKLINHLYLFKNSETEYYHIRKLNFKTNEKRAAQFIYLNRTSFNGIYRVNSLGQYNVPYGKRKSVDVVSEKLLLHISRCLQGVNLDSLSFEDTIKNVKKDDLVFIDPPYTVAHENNGFIEYNQKLFSWDDQLKLKEYIKQIINKKAYFILTNASHNSIHDLYDNVGLISKLTRPSKVGGRNKTRGNFNELLIYNTRK